MPLQLSVTFNQIVGQVIAYHRKQRGWNQSEFGERLLLSESAVSRLESGDHKVTVELLDRASYPFSTKGWKLLYDVEKVAGWLERRGVEISYNIEKTMSKDELMKQVALALNLKRRKS